MGEIASAKLLHHREADPPGSDFRNARRFEEREVIVKRTNGSAKVLIIIGSFLIPLLIGTVAYFLGRDRAAIDRDIAAAHLLAAQAKDATTAQSTQLATLTAQQAALSAQVAEVKKETAETKVLVSNVLVEIRRSR